MKINEKTHSFLSYSYDILRYKKLITFVNILCNTVIFSRQAAITLFVRQILNTLESSQGTALRASAPYLLGIVAVVVIRIAAIMGCAALDALRSYYYQNRVRANVLNLLLKKDDVTRVAGHSGAIFEVLDNDIPISTFPAELLTEVTGYFIFTLITLAVLLSINWKLTLFIFIPLSASIYGIQRLSQRMRERRRQNRSAHDAAAGFTGDVVDAALAIKACGAEEAVLKRYDSVNKTRRSAALEDTLLNAKIGVLLQGAVYTGSAIMMFAAARLLSAGEFGIGDFSLFIAHLGTLASCIERIAELVAESRRAEVSFERILNIAGNENKNALNTDAGITLHPIQSRLQCQAYSQKTPLSFEVRKLSYTYEDGRGFKDVSFTIRPGELTVVAGEVGSGKSTLLSVLMGLLPADSGELIIGNKPVCLSEREPFIIAGAPQRSGFFSKTLEENLCLGFPASIDDMKRALSIAALDDFAAGAPQTLSLNVGSRGGRLSGGQQQRLALARMILRGAQLSIADDCVSALDKDTRQKLLHQLLAYLRQTSRSAVIATNESDFLKAADQVLLIENGRMA